MNNTDALQITETFCSRSILNVVALIDKIHYGRPLPCETIWLLIAHDFAFNEMRSYGPPRTEAEMILERQQYLEHADPILFEEYEPAVAEILRNPLLYPNLASLLRASRIYPIAA